MQIDDFLANAKAQSQLRKMLRENSSVANKANRSYRELSELLINSYFKFSEFPVAQQQALVPFLLELVQTEWGLEAALGIVLNLHEAGISSRILALPAQSACRREGNYERAVSILEKLASSDHSNEYASLVLGQALAANGHFQKLEKLAEQQRTTTKPTEWFASQWTTLLTNNLQFDAALHWMDLLPAEHDLRDHVKTRVRSFDSAGIPLGIPTYVVSLFRDDRKWQIAEKHLTQGGYAPSRFKAVDGRELPIYALEHLGGSSEAFNTHGAGAIATALSHISVAEALLTSGDERWLVLEDDASPFMHSSAYSDYVEQTKDIDFVWVNERMSSQFGKVKIGDQMLLDPWSTLGSRDPRLNGVGADAYLLNRTGAEKILELINFDKIQAHIDAQFAAYCTFDAQNADNLSRGQEVVLQLKQRLPSFIEQRTPLSSICFSNPMIWANNHGSSDTFSISAQRRKELSKL